MNLDQFFEEDLSVNKMYVDAVATGLSMHTSKPTNPQKGDCYMNSSNSSLFVYDGNQWSQITHGGGTIHVQ